MYEEKYYYVPHVKNACAGEDLLQVMYLLCSRP
jgi:hypothetical protein